MQVEQWDICFDGFFRHDIWSFPMWTHMSRSASLPKIVTLLPLFFSSHLNFRSPHADQIPSWKNSTRSPGIRPSLGGQDPDAILRQVIRLSCNIFDNLSLAVRLLTHIHCHPKGAASARPVKPGCSLIAYSVVMGDGCKDVKCNNRYEFCAPLPCTQFYKKSCNCPYHKFDSISPYSDFSYDILADPEPQGYQGFASNPFYYYPTAFATCPSFPLPHRRPASNNLA